jgi:lipoprotein-anchoring transpeptidase ErfK/SrfK
VARPSAFTVVFAIMGLLLAAMGMAAANQARTQRAEAKKQEASKPAPAQRLAINEGYGVGSDAAPLRPIRAPEPSFPIATVRPGRSVAVYRRPRGPVVQLLNATTEFGSRRTFAVAARRGRWLGVTTTTLPNAKLDWIEKSRAVRVASTRISLHIDLSKRSLELHRGSKVIRKARVGIGRPGAPTPTGRFAVTDKLAGGKYGAYYGCCILALSGHQPNLPKGWPGGDRLAIHGTNNPAGIGKQVSAGCLHAAAADLRLLMKRVPLGTPVFISR